jgi:hypothetical protein
VALFYALDVFCPDLLPNSDEGFSAAFCLALLARFSGVAVFATFRGGVLH